MTLDKYNLLDLKTIAISSKMFVFEHELLCRKSYIRVRGYYILNLHINLN